MSLKKLPLSHNLLCLLLQESKLLTCSSSYFRKLDEGEFRQLLSFLDNHKPGDNVIQLTASQTKSEEDSLRSNSYGMNAHVTMDPPLPNLTKLHSASSKFQLSRMFLSHLGILSLEGRSRVSILDASPALTASLNTLDKQPE